MKLPSCPHLKEVYETVLSRYSQQPAVTFQTESYTYGKLDHKSAKLANGLLDLGLESTDRVGLLMANRPEFTISQFATVRAGLAYVPLNNMLSMDDIIFMLEDSRTSVALVGPDFFDSIDEIYSSVDSLEQIITIDGKNVHPNAKPFDDFIQDHSTKSPTVDVNSEQLVAMYYTGGTTGPPKGVQHTQGNLALNTFSHISEFEIYPDDTWLFTAPLSHASGFFMGGTLLKGCHHVITKGFEPKQAMELIEQEKVNGTYMVPTMIYRVLNHLDEKSYDTSSLRLLCYGSSPMKPARLTEGLEKLGDVFSQIYGLIEIPNLVTVLPKSAHDPHDEQLLNSCGREIMMCQVKVVREDGSEADTHEKGEILVKSSYMMDGYFELPEKTNEVIDDGWFHTGDIGMFDQNGYLYILDRKADMIITGGLNVYSTEVENVIQELDSVDNVAVFGIPHDDWGEAVHATVVPKQEELEASAIKEYCDKRLARYEKPKTIEFVDEIPTTSIGKADKKVLKQPYWEEEARRVS